MIKHVALAALLATALLGCEHPAEPDDTAEARGAIPALRGNEPRWTREETQQARQTDEGPRSMMPMPGPRTNTPGGVAAGLDDALG